MAGRIRKAARRLCRCRQSSRAAVCAFAVLVAAATGACGGQGQASHVTPRASAGHSSGSLKYEPAAVILQQAGAATTALRSVRVSGRLSGSAIDEFMSSPCQSTGTIGFQGVVIHEIRLGNLFYFRANAAFYQKIGARNAMPERWRATTVEMGLRAGFLPGPHLCIGPFLRQTATISGGDPSALTKDGVRTVQGEPAITLLDSQNDALYVSATGQPYVLALALQGGDYVNFSGFNQPVPITAPASCPPGQPAVSSTAPAIIC
jgi:hypothetical protein